MRFGPDEIGSYGVVATEGDVGADDVVRIVTTVEKPARGTEPSDLAIMGRYVLTPDVFDRIARLKPGAGGEIQLTDALCTMAEDGPFYGLVFDARPLRHRQQARLAAGHDRGGPAPSRGRARVPDRCSTSC